jgi:NADH:ubiquinone oxidoreductase subunit 5 (subunit L)/multisubunit Na+/H+ antiporter MnhA subunit
MLDPTVILLPPLAAMAVIVLSRSRRVARYAALAGCLLGLLLLPLVNQVTESVAWFSAGNASFGLTISMGTLNVLLAAAILVAGLIAALCSFVFAKLPSRQLRLYLGVMALETPMLALAMAGNFVLLSIAWAFLSVTCYLLAESRSGARAGASARRFLTVSLVGDIALVAAMAVLFSAFGSLEFSSVMGSLNAVPRSAIVLLALAALSWPAGAICASRAFDSADRYLSEFVEIFAEGVAYFDASLDGALGAMGRVLASLGETKNVAEADVYMILFAAGLLLLLAAMVVVA